MKQSAIAKFWSAQEQLIIRLLLCGVLMSSFAPMTSIAEPSGEDDISNGVLLAARKEGVKSQLKSQTSQSKAAAAYVTMVVATDGAIVFDRPNQDANVMTQLPYGKKVRVSRGSTRGGEDRFRRIRVGSKSGYILEIDVAPENSISEADINTGKKQVAKNAKKKRDSQRERKRPKEPFYFTRYVGLTGGFADFKESINGVDAVNNNLLIYGLKITGPEVLFSGPTVDLNILLHYGAPEYYEKLSKIKPTGFILFTDALFVLPVLNRENGMIYVEAGPLLVYSSFKVLNGTRVMDLTSVNLGASFAAGAGFRVEKVAVRLEGKYLVEKQSYKAVQLSLQTEF
jgi:hypothetical protein